MSQSQTDRRDSNENTPAKAGWHPTAGHEPAHKLHPPASEPSSGGKGSVRWIETLCVVDETGQPIQMIGAATDITERKNVEAALRHASQRKDEFLAMLGHELRNPLTAIRHAVQITNESPTDVVTRAWASEVIDRQSLQLSRMVDDLLDVTRISRGRIELRPEVVDLREILSRAVNAVRALMEQRGHAFSQEIAEGDLRLPGDATRLEQIFVNLLNNAAKYTAQGGKIRLRAQIEGNRLVVSISDNGIGMGPDLLPRVFDLFVQADSSLDRAQGGLGIGLTLVKTFVEMHDGEVTVESPGASQGTTVTVRLPRFSEEAPAPKPEHFLSRSSALARRVRVLIVDDHVDGAEALARLLRHRNCEIRLAHDGPSGVAAAREFQPEVLLLDLGLPVFDGYELVRTLREDATFDEALFIAVSGYAQESDRQQSIAAGFNEHFAKPLDFTALMQAIRRKALEEE